MGKISNVMNHYLSERRRFADLINGVFFQGKTVIRAEELEEASENLHGCRYFGSDIGIVECS